VDSSQPDPEAAVAFYSGLFGWDFEDVMPPGSPGEYCIARLDGGDVAAVASAPEGGPPGAAWNTYIWVDSADEAAAKVADAGGRVVIEPFDVPAAGRMAVLADPEGAEFRVWQAREHKGARIVNRPGSLNFNGVSSRDPARAKSFYRSVFGWEVLGLGGGAEMWRLPGYGEFLERGDPGLRQRMADSGAPAGFEDVIATLERIDRAGDRAHWSVTFAVESADETAAKATQLGARVIAPPFDAPWVRMSVIADPQGATFTASQFVLENKNLGRQSDATLSAA
jgi:predicted enzyme related to lactoylglutathione lyase